jgi:hypothetical protein
MEIVRKTSNIALPIHAALNLENFLLPEYENIFPISNLRLHENKGLIPAT